MSIPALFKSKQPVVSLEVFPPKPDSPPDVIESTLKKLAPLQPDYVSVTYGAGGSKAQLCAELADSIRKLCQCPVLGHLTCVGADPASIDAMVDRYLAAGVTDILALRGDVPEGMNAANAFTHFRYASDLVTHLAKRPGLGIAAACYPEGHFESVSASRDLDHLKYKVDCGAQLLVTQLFFDNEAFYAFVDRTRRAGITVPITAGIMPVLNSSQILRMATLCGASIPAPLSKIFARYANDPASFRSAGMDYCCSQLLNLKQNGVDGIHLYSMNRPASSTAILTRTGLR
ncbi:MAG: methylenetetrahydrofolate reductase [Clostridia bacterium]|nr:methylenetetrahydrofolate reductase [Clostridia bacterium]